MKGRQLKIELKFAKTFIFQTLEQTETWNKKDRSLRELIERLRTSSAVKESEGAHRLYYKCNVVAFLSSSVPLCHLGSALTARRWTRREPSSARPASDRDSLRLRPLFKKARRQCRRHPTQSGSVRAVRLWIKAAASSARCVSALVWPLALQSHRCCPAQDLCLTAEQRLVF